MNSRWSLVLGSAIAGLVTSLGVVAPAEAAPAPIVVGTYNVKDPDTTAYAAWPDRAPLLVQNILGEAPAVLGLQEIYEDDERDLFFSTLSQASNKTYDVTVSPRAKTGYDSRIIYNTSLLSVDRSTIGSYRYARQFPGDPGVAEGDVNRGRQMAWAVFTIRSNGSRFLFVTTHLCPSSDPVTKAQWNELLLKVKELAATYAVPVVVSGDFNTTKFEGPARRLLKKMRKAGFGDVLGQTFRSYATVAARAVGAERINANYSSSNPSKVARNKNGNSIDWVFASNQLDVTQYHLTLRRDLSDHNMVTSTIVFP